ncbi:MAG: tetratricopeptide repeat protein [Acidobacteriota bacterium]|jgi:tetratricopeptide (TPR) repeat protein
MKKEHLLMLVAGFVLGAVVCFIIMKQYNSQEQAKMSMAAQQAAQGQSQPQQPAQNGKADFNQQQHNAEIEQFIAKAKADPNDLQSKVMLGNIYYDMGDYAKAIPWYEDALKINNQDTDVMVDLGVCYRQEKNPEKALALFKKALTLDPSKKQALFNQVVVYKVDLHQDAMARKIFKKYQELFPGDASVKELATLFKKS